MKIAVCLAVIIFAVSCNEKPTDSTNSGVSDMSSGDDFTVIKLDKTTSSIKKEAIYTFYVSPPDTSTTVTMSKVDVDQGSPIQGITLNPEDFILTPDLKDGMILTLKLSLSDTGIQKFKDAKEATEIRYRAELDFKTSGQTKKMTISISVIPVHITTKQEVENMIKALGTIEVSPDGAPGIKSSFDFSGFQLSETEFEIEESGSGGSYNYSVGTADDAIGKQLTYLLSQQPHNGLGLIYKNEKYYKSGGNDKSVIFIYILDIDSKYALEDSAAFITGYDPQTGKGGIRVKLTLKGSNKWLNY
ncbi:hypothetical protein R4J03_00310 [Brachyspira intermedia]|uniref:hypothetical protein n=2 Tax=Brachyspira intermedia TaxID=84377 RepID=UPI0026106E04|nr:hypothetical protein [uncultured Brachyspira sp.]